MTTSATERKSFRKGKRVSTKHVDDLVSTYKKERWLYNSEKLGKPDALSAWYGLEELSAFLDEAKKHQADGIKMYYGVYPSDYADVPEYAGRQTVVLVATRQKKTSAGVINKDIFINSGDGSQILAFNLGSACPPLCGSELPDGDQDWHFDMSGVGLTIIEKNDTIIIA